MLRKHSCYIVTIAALCGSLCVFSQTDEPDDFLREARNSYEQFKASGESEYNSFREKANRDYEEFMRRPWQPHHSEPVVPLPPDPSPPPFVLPDDMPVAPRRVPLDTVVSPVKVSPKPYPVCPIDEEPSADKPQTIEIKLYGTPLKVRKPDMPHFRIGGVSERDFADAWRRLCDFKMNNLLRDCLDNRDSLDLSDWAYLRMLQKVASMLTPAGSNEEAMLTGFLLNQSGYNVRYAVDERGRLDVLFATGGCLFNKQYFHIEGLNYFPLRADAAKTVRICNVAYPQEQAIYMGIRSSQKLAYAPAKTRTISVHARPQLTLSVTPNANLIEFYNDMPDCSASAQPSSKWAMYANVPASPELERDLYPALRESVNGMNQRDAANLLMDVAETFPYGYDSQIWGYDRAFFPDETWYYPYSDCEDHAIHFSRMVRDILRLRVVLVVYPNHLATAVHFTDGSATGDYIMIGSEKWIVCDPTIFYAPIGRTMSGQDNASATVLRLD